MTRSDLVKNLKIEFPNLPQSVLHQAVELFFAEMAATVIAGGRVEIRGLGVFFATIHPPGEKINPKTREKLGPSTLTRVRYRPSSNF